MNFLEIWSFLVILRQHFPNQINKKGLIQALALLQQGGNHVPVDLATVIIVNLITILQGAGLKQSQANSKNISLFLVVLGVV